ncbi:MAG TPA: SDR family oxidoreductase [Bryobacteraceae bacterium]|jgi:NAD(P)-dependent dehydrogenase (short-subunit alcohol dehydrogenase family)|nr:SDR family oxidoreductase [Bryobacteraceae bacterium]
MKHTPVETVDPRTKGEKPPFPAQNQELPGTEQEMSPKPDHGEKSYRGYGRLQGKVALITGADSGIGRAVAIAYAREGADVLISFLNEQEDAEETGSWVREAGRRPVLAPGDIGEEPHCRELVDRAFREWGRLDILVNNAGIQTKHQHIEEWSPEEWDRTFKTNIYAMFYLARHALPRMQTGGSIINTASVQAYQPNPELLAYAATKGAIVTFTKALASMAMEGGIRVNAVAPGPVWTPLIPASFEEDKVKNFGEKSLLGRPAQPAELAPVYVFLASPESSYVTGSVVDMTGGRMLP